MMLNVLRSRVDAIVDAMLTPGSRATSRTRIGE